MNPSSRAKRIIAVGAIIIVVIFILSYIFPVLAHPQKFYSAFTEKMNEEQTSELNWQTRLSNAWEYAYGKSCSGESDSTSVQSTVPED